jgi:hypothetical protein
MNIKNTKLECNYDIVMPSADETGYLKHITAVAYCGVDGTAGGGCRGGGDHPSQSSWPQISIHHVLRTILVIIVIVNIALTSY